MLNLALYFLKITSEWILFPHVGKHLAEMMAGQVLAKELSALTV